MLEVVCLSTCLLFTGSMREFGGGGPASANDEDLKEPRVGISTKQDVWRLWANPPRNARTRCIPSPAGIGGKVTVVLTFNDNLDILVDRKVLKN